MWSLLPPVSTCASFPDSLGELDLLCGIRLERRCLELCGLALRSAQLDVVGTLGHDARYLASKRARNLLCEVSRCHLNAQLLTNGSVRVFDRVMEHRGLQDPNVRYTARRKIVCDGLCVS